MSWRGTFGRFPPFHGAINIVVHMSNHQSLNLVKAMDLMQPCQRGWRSRFSCSTRKPWNRRPPPCNSLQVSYY